MSNEPAPAPEAAGPGRTKTGVARKLRRLVAILVLIVVAVLAVRTVAFAFAEKKYRSTARIFLKAAKAADERDQHSMVRFADWSPPQAAATCAAEICGALIAERAEARMSAAHPGIKIQPCQVEATVTQTYILVISATAKDASYAQTYLDMLIEGFVALYKEMREADSKAREHGLQFGTATAKQAATSSEKLAETKAALDKFHRPSRELTVRLAKEETQQREAAEEQFIIIEHASPGVRIIPRFTFLRLF